MGPEILLTVAAVAAGGAFLLYRRATAPKDPNTPIFSTFGFNSLHLRSSEYVNHDTKRLIFELPNPKLASGLGLTSAVLAVSRPSGPFPVLRPYTPVNDLDEPGVLELLVKKYPNGKQSSHLHSLQAGQTMTFAPIKGYKWKPNAFERIALVAGGQGITPCYQLVRHILKDPQDSTRMTLVWGVNSEHDILLLNEFKELQAAHPDRLSVTYVVSKPPPGSSYAKGFVTKQILEDAGASPAKGVEKVFLCGPPPMEKALAGTKGWFGSQGDLGILGQLGYKRDQIVQF